MPLCLQGHLLLEFGMKSEYRCLVEMIISDERKLAEATKLHAEALERFQKAAETLVIVGRRLEEKRAQLCKLDALIDKARPASGGGSAAPQDLSSVDAGALLQELKSMSASMKILCREVMRPEA